MDAAVQCLAELGYAATTTTEVAKAAHMTRAAMQYHFPSRMDLIEACVHYVTRRRLEMYEAAMSEIPHDRDYFVHAIDIGWEQLQKPEFLAFTELSLAARSDRELAVMFSPALAEYDRARRLTAQRLFPPGQVDMALFDLRNDIISFLLEGLAQQRHLAFDADRRRAMVLGFLKALSTSRDAGGMLQKAQEWTTPESSLLGTQLPDTLPPPDLREGRPQRIAPLPAPQATRPACRPSRAAAPGS